MTTVREHAESYAAAHNADADHLVAVWWMHGIEPTAEALDALWSTFAGDVPAHDADTAARNPHIAARLLVEPPAPEPERDGGED